MRRSLIPHEHPLHIRNNWILFSPDTTEEGRAGGLWHGLQTKK